MTTLGNNVKLVPESVEYAETDTDLLKKVEYNVPQALWESQAPTFGDAYPGDTAPWGYIVVDVQAGKSARSPDQGAYHGTVTYAQVKTPYTSGITGLREGVRRFGTGRRGRRTGTRVFYTDDNGAEGLVASALREGAPMQASGSWKAAELREKDIECRWRVGLTRVTCQYDSYAPSGEIAAANKCVLEADATAVMMWNRMPVPGTSPERRIDEIYFDETAKVRKCWVRVEGNNAFPLVRADYRLRGTLDHSNVAQVGPLVGKVNSDACSHIGGAAGGTLWFNQFSMRQRKRGEGRRYDVVMSLSYDPGGWDSVTKAQLQKCVIREQDVEDEDGAGLSVYQRLASWVPDDATAKLTEIPLPDGTASLALLNSYLK